MLSVHTRLCLRSMLEGAASVRLDFGYSQREHEANALGWNRSIHKRKQWLECTTEQALKAEIRHRSAGQWSFFLISLALLAATLASAMWQAPDWVALSFAGLNALWMLAPTCFLRYWPEPVLVAVPGSSARR